MEKIFYDIDLYPLQLNHTYEADTPATTAIIMRLNFRNVRHEAQQVKCIKVDSTATWVINARWKLQPEWPIPGQYLRPMNDKYRTNTSVTVGNKYLAATLPPGQYEENTLVKLAIIMGINF